MLNSLTFMFRPPDTVAKKRREINQGTDNVVDLEQNDESRDKTLRLEAGPKRCRGFWPAKERLVPLAQKSGKLEVFH